MAKDKPNLSMRIDNEIREHFKEETYQNGITMTVAIERLMVAYINSSRTIRNGKQG